MTGQFFFLQNCRCLYSNIWKQHFLADILISFVLSIKWLATGQNIMKVEFAHQKKMISTIIFRIWTRISNSVTLVATNSLKHSFLIAQVIKVDGVMRFFKIKLSFPSFSALKRNMIATLKYTGAYLNSSWMHILQLFSFHTCYRNSP